MQTAALRYECLLGYREGLLLCISQINVFQYESEYQDIKTKPTKPLNLPLYGILIKAISLSELGLRENTKQLLCYEFSDNKEHGL